MKNVPITSLEKLKEARKIGQEAGLKHIHLGNIFPQSSHTSAV